jgi:hypothetical protein
MADKNQAKKRKINQGKIEIKRGEFKEVDEIVDFFQNEKKWCEDLKFYKITVDHKWLGKITCSGPCMKNNAPIQLRAENGRMNYFNRKSDFFFQFSYFQI